MGINLPKGTQLVTNRPPDPWALRPLLLQSLQKWYEPLGEEVYFHVVLEYISFSILY